MKTYQDLMELTMESDRMQFCYNAINEYKTSELYKNAYEGDKYARQQNVTITNYRKLLYTMSGKAVADNYTANHKCASNFFSRFMIQRNQSLLGNGVSFNDEATKEKLGGAEFDYKVVEAGENALTMGVSYGFMNLDHIEVFSALEFVPLWDEETGALRGGIRYWQIDAKKPLRATLYEEDGYTEYIKRKGEDIAILTEKRAYKLIANSSVALGTEIVGGENYEGFPIVPLWANAKHQSELIGMKENIDCYDLIKSGFANDLDDASMIYWTINNAGGMDDIDLAKFVERMRTVKASVIDDDGASAQAHTMDVPYQSREAYLKILEDDLYADAMALNTDRIAGGNNTATAIQASYEPLNSALDRYEYQVTKFIKGLMKLIGVDDEPIYKRSRITNQAEETQMILSASEYLDNETILKHLPFLSVDEIEGILDRTTKEEAERFANGVDDAE